MAIPKTARVVAAREIAPHTRLLDLELSDRSALGFRGGQYVIVNTGVVLAGGKLAKRAYSLLSSDAVQASAQIAVKRLDGGPGSSALHLATIGTELAFSGPWGKLTPDEGATGPALVFCTDTGITAGLGLVTGSAFRPLAARAELVWYVERDSFVAEDFVRARLAGTPVALRVEPALPVHHPERVAHATALVRRLVAERGAPREAFLTGDGHIVYAIRDLLDGARLPAERIRLEAFFNNPDRKAPP
jgi:ferredoxin-NADP reductase